MKYPNEIFFKNVHLVFNPLLLSKVKICLYKVNTNEKKPKTNENKMEL